MSIFGVFLVRIFPDSDWIQRDTSYLSVFSPNAGKSGPEKLRIWTRFTQWIAENMNAISPLPSISLLLLISIYLFIVCRRLFHKVRYIWNMKDPNLWTTPDFYLVSFWRREKLLSIFFRFHQNFNSVNNAQHRLKTIVSVAAEKDLSVATDLSIIIQCYYYKQNAGFITHCQLPDGLAFFKWTNYVRITSFLYK